MVRRMVFQWHICDACNLKCLHCYQEDKPLVQLPFDDLLNILEQYKKMLHELNVYGHINVTGGEPFCSPHFFKLLDEFKKDKDLYSFSILTNGTLINEETAKRIKEYGPEFVQVSLEGGKKVNDFVRGKGTFKVIGNAIKLLKKQNIFVSVSFTSTKLNYKEFPKVVRFAEKCGADSVWSDRFIPLGTEHDKEFLMSKEETNEFLSIMQSERMRLRLNRSKTHVSMQRALQFQKTYNFPYECSAGKELVVVMENGDLVPCRRMPIVVGNLRNEDMFDLYTNNEVFKKLRNDNPPDECKGCQHEKSCRGGLKCLTYAIYGDLNHKDVGCMAMDE